VTRAKEAIGVSFPSVRRYLGRPEETGIVHQIPGEVRNRLHRAGEMIRAIEAPWGTSRARTRKEAGPARFVRRRRNRRTAESGES